MNLALIRSMYVLEYKSTTEIAEILGKPRRTINFILHQMGVELRSRTNRRTCKVQGCNKECFKRVVSNGKQVVLSGSMCREHDREYWRLKSLARRRKVMYSKTQVLKDEQREAPKPISDSMSSSTATA
jgi:hypothetical protein